MTRRGNAQSRGILPGQKTHPAGHTHRVLHKKVIEIHALTRQAFQIRRLHIGIPIRPHRIPSLLIRVNQ